MTFQKDPVIGFRHDNVVLFLGAYLAQDLRQ